MTEFRSLWALEVPNGAWLSLGADTVVRNTAEAQNLRGSGSSALRETWSRWRPQSLTTDKTITAGTRRSIHLVESVSAALARIRSPDRPCRPATGGPRHALAYASLEDRHTRIGERRVTGPHPPPGRTARLVEHSIRINRPIAHACPGCGCSGHFASIGWADGHQPRLRPSAGDRPDHGMACHQEIELAAEIDRQVPNAGVDAGVEHVQSLAA